MREQLMSYKDKSKITLDFEYEYFKKIKGIQDVQRQDNSKAKSTQSGL